MGAIWLHGGTPGYPHVLEVLENAGVSCSGYQGWTTRSRSSGGMNKFMGIVCHHTASKTNPANDLNYMVYGSPDNPVSNGLLDRTGHFTCIAAGATNHAGKGGGSSSGGGAPWVTSKGTVPADSANSNTFGIEAANDGVGEPWPQAQQDAYIKMCAALCDAYGLIPELDTISHHLWTPGRKIDPRGPSRWQPANGSMPWDFPRFRADVAAAMGGATPTPPPSSEEDDMPKAIFNPLIQATGKDGTVAGAVYLTDQLGIQYRYIQDPTSLADIQYALRTAGLPDTIQQVDNVSAFGVLIGHNPNTRKA